MAEGNVCVCPQCGKKFKLKAGFSAASFACSGCGATVWVEGKAPTSGRRKSGAGAGRGRRAAGRGRAKAAAAPKARRAARGRRREEPAEEGAQEGRRGRYQRPQSSNTTVIAIAAVAVVAVVAIGFLMMGGKDEPAPERGTPVASQPGDTGAIQPGINPTPASPDPSATGPAVASPKPEAPAAPADETPAAGDEPADEGPDDLEDKEAPSAPARKLGGDTSKKASPKLKTRWDPPGDLPHLESTPPDLRAKIDEWIGLMMDPMAGRDSLDAKAKLAATGKPAFLPVLAAMARVRDTISDNDSHEERMIESSLKLADECLREMDGYLNSKNKGVIRPGTDKKYIEYILRLHYKRWLTTLEDMAEMPGPYDPSQEYLEPDEEEDPSGRG